MKTIVIYTDGTLGDHLPSIALGQALAARGYRVRMAINQAMHQYAARTGLPAIALTDVERGPEEARKNAWAWNHWRNPADALPSDFTPMGPGHFATQTRDLIEICRDADLLLATSIRFLGYLVHQAIGIPWLTISLNPPTFVQPTSTDEQVVFRQTRTREFEQLKELFAPIFAELGIAHSLSDWRPGVLFARHILLASSPQFSPLNVEQFQPHASLDLTGFWFYQDPTWKDWQPDAALARFCERRPIVLSFSSQPLEERRETLAKHVHAAANLGRPLLIQRGWADFSEDDLPANVKREDILFADFVPHDWLFAHAACAIQHGGIGSIARALQQGCPLLIEPYGNDQFYNADRVAELGVGAAVSPFHATVGDLTQILSNHVLTPACRERAQAFSAQLNAEDGLTTACEMIERFLGRLDAQGHLPGVYERYTPPLTPRKRQTPSESTTPPPANQNTPMDKPMLILFYNQMWDQPLELEHASLPADCRWTTDRQYLAQADVVVFHVPSLDTLPGWVKAPGQIWVAWSQECAVHYSHLQNPAFMRHFDLTMTYRRDSDVPVSYFGVEFLQALQSPPHPKNSTDLAALLVSSQVAQNGRLAYLAELMRHLNVHSYGKQLNNQTLANDRGRSAKLGILAKHKFALAFENATAPDYVTEKFFDPLLVGSVPVYLGAPNIDEFAPGEHCLIKVSDFASPEKLAAYLNHLNTDDAAYAEYLTWRTKPLRADFVRLLETQRENFLVRLYRRVRQMQATPNHAAATLATPITVESITIPKILHQTWKDENLPAHLQAFRQTWQTHHPTWEFRLWTDLDNRELIRQHYAWFLPIYDSYPENIMRADAARYFILHRYGGVYADLDVECLRPLDPLIAKSLVLGLEHPAHLKSSIARQRGLQTIVGNAVMGAVPQHPFWEHVSRQLVALHRAPSPLDATGPFLLTHACATYEYPEQISLASHQWLYPTSNEKPWSEVAPEAQTQITQTAFTIHHWQGTWWREAITQQTQQVKLALLAHGETIGTTVMSVDRYRALLATHPQPPKISCLMVTKNRVAWAQRAVHCFQQQTYTNRELVIVDDSADDTLEHWVRELGDARIVYVHLPAENKTLGELRNHAVSRATGEYIAQWDDDDLSDPWRLEIQMAVIYALQTEACCLERQQILWLNNRRLAVSTRRIWEGSFLCAKAVLPAYPTQRQGEDTSVVEQIVAHHRIALLDMPQLYTYVFHGDNTFAAEHWEKHWVLATESFQGPLFDAMFQALQTRLQIKL